MAINKAERFDVFKLEPNGMPTWRGGYPSLEGAVLDARRFTLRRIVPTILSQTC